MFHREVQIQTGFPDPMGATVMDGGVNFAVYSKNAKQVVLCLFSHFNRETHHIPMNRTGDVWHVFVKKLKAGKKYGYRVYGDYDPTRGLWFNFHKLLLDPCAKQITAPIMFHASQLPYVVDHKKREMSYSTVNSAPFMPRCVVIDDAKIKPAKSTKPHIPWEKTVIYETHVKGFTHTKKNISRRSRGTFAGLGMARTTAYLKDLGVTAVELLPVYAFNTSDMLINKQLSNYWGYDPVCFMAVQPTYLATGQVEEIKKTVQALHAEGLEVILDVVYNHTGEGGYMGPLLSFRGLDNGTYYRLMPNDARYYMDDTGCGNTFDMSNPVALKLAIQSLRYWAEVFDIDGFRFDLAVTLGRGADNEFNPKAAFFKALKADPILSQVKLIAEPWDLGPNGYQLGNFPPFMAEWNGAFRDIARRFWKGDMGQAGALVDQMTKPLTAPKKEILKKVNFITAHDGFSLYDLVSYNFKHNDANKEQNRDGTDVNYSWNSGTEGHTSNPIILDFRFRRMKAMIATLLFGNGVPMILSGDEVMRTQWGNNNAYAQDSKVSWFHWKRTKANEDKMHDFVREVIALRTRMGEFDKTAPDVALRPDGTPMMLEDWQSYVRSFALLMKAKSTYYFVFNASDMEMTYKVPKLDKVVKWQLVLDSSQTVTSLTMQRGKFTVPSWSVMVLKG